MSLLRIAWVRLYLIIMNKLDLWLNLMILLLKMKNASCFQKAKGYAMKDTNQVDYTVKIRNLKDEAKDEDEESGIDD